MEENRRSGVSAIVLAAGMSTRMGSPKQLLRIDGTTLLEIALETLRKTQIQETVVVLGASADAIRQSVSLDRVKVVINEAYREGMGTSLRVGLSAVDPVAQAALVVLADQPFLQASTIDTLIEQHRERQPQIVIPLYRGFRGNPVLLDRSVFAELAGLTGDVGCRAIFGSHTENILKMPVDDMGILLDIDTPSDLESLQEARASAIAYWEGPEPAADRPQLAIVGQEAVAQALVKLGSLLHFTVVVVDPILTAAQTGADGVLHALDFSRLPAAAGTYVAVASRGRFDEEAVEQALLAKSDYVALVSNKKRSQEIVASLKARGFAPENLAALHAPAGIAIGAEGPEEIALSVMAEIVAERRRSRTG
ncbi:MAG TPA: NTP transferase domain-containing protein [Bryobacteraceae bacterium]|nr:NTP transferase domain-containing protein [Bryobacteraceae bacterium]